MEQIKELRKALGLKQPDMAKEMDMQVSTYANFENGIYKPKKLRELQGKAIDILIAKVEQKKEELTHLVNAFI